MEKEREAVTPELPPRHESHDASDDAAQLERLLPRLMRHLFATDAGSPASDLTIAQLRVCTLLQDGTHSLSSVARELGISTSAATQIADRLERLGLVERIAQTEDRRAKHLLLTPHGEATMRTRRLCRVHRVQEVLDRVPVQSHPELMQSVKILLEAALTVPVPADIDVESV